MSDNAPRGRDDRHLRTACPEVHREHARLLGPGGRAHGGEAYRRPYARPGPCWLLLRQAGLGFQFDLDLVAHDNASVQ